MRPLRGLAGFRGTPGIALQCAPSGGWRWSSGLCGEARLGLKMLLRRWLGSGERVRMRARLRRPDDPDSPPAWAYPDPFTGKLVYPPEDPLLDRLRAMGIPELRNLEDLAGFLGCSWRRTLWLASPTPRYAMTSPHYAISTRPKWNGGQRLILAPINHQPVSRYSTHQVMKLDLDGLQIGENICVVKLQIVQAQGAGMVVYKF